MTQAIAVATAVGNGPAFSAYSSSGGSLATATQTLVPYNNKTGSVAPAFDTAGCYNNTNGTVTLNGISTPAYSFAPNVAGYYLISANVGVYYPSTGTYVYVAFQKNGNTTYFNAVGGGNGSSVELSPTGSVLVYMNGTSDTFAIKVYTNASSTTIDSGQSTVFSGYLVRTA